MMICRIIVYFRRVGTRPAACIARKNLNNVIVVLRGWCYHGQLVNYSDVGAQIEKINLKRAASVKMFCSPLFYRKGKINTEHLLLFSMLKPPSPSPHRYRQRCCRSHSSQQNHSREHGCTTKAAAAAAAAVQKTISSAQRKIIPILTSIHGGLQGDAGIWLSKWQRGDIFIITWKLITVPKTRSEEVILPLTWDVSTISFCKQIKFSPNCQTTPSSWITCCQGFHLYFRHPHPPSPPSLLWSYSIQSHLVRVLLNLCSVSDTISVYFESSR